MEEIVMDRPKTNNLTAWIQGRNLNVFQKADAVIEYNHLLDYISEKEQLILSGVVKSFTAEQVGDMLANKFTTIEEAIHYFDNLK